MSKPNVDVEFRHKKTGCGTSVLMTLTHEDCEELKRALSLPGLDMEVIAVEYPYVTKAGA